MHAKLSKDPNPFEAVYEQNFSIGLDWVKHW